MQVLGRKTGKHWTLLKVGVRPEMFDTIIDLMQANLLDERGVPYYAHFYRDDELIIVFPSKIFHVTPDKNSWSEAVSYGESVGIPKDELDFRPCKLTEETY